MGAGAEQRRDVRVKLHCTISVRFGDQQVQGETDNVSVRGVMVSVPEDTPLERGDEVEVEFTLPGASAATRCAATVRWSSQVLPGVLGLEFKAALDPSTAAILDQHARDQGA